MANLLFLGSGSAFTVGADNFQANMLLTNNNGKTILIDCGSDIRFSLNTIGWSYLNITDIYISHLHADHVGGLEYIGLSTKFDPGCEKPNLYLREELAIELWENTLSGGMKSLQGEIANLNNFFQVHPIDNRNCFIWEEIKFNLIKVVHVDNGCYVMPSYGLFFEVDNLKIFLSTDTQFRLDLMGNLYEQADVIFHDCETSKYPSPVHAHYNQLIDLPSYIKQKMWLYGYQPGELPNAITDGFCGFVKRGQTFNFKNLQRQYNY